MKLKEYQNALLKGLIISWVVNAILFTAALWYGQYLIMECGMEWVDNPREVTLGVTGCTKVIITCCIAVILLSRHTAIENSTNED